MQMLPLAGASPARDAGPDGIQQILSAVRAHLGMDVSFIAEFANGRRIFRHVESADDKRFIAVGDSDPLEDSYCWWIARGKLPRMMRDPRDHPLTRLFPATEALPVGAHLSIPITLRDGALFGTFCCFSTTPDRSLTSRDLATMEAFAELAAAQVQSRVDEQSERDAQLAAIRAVIARRDLDIVFQPAVRLDRPQVAFVEALARFRPQPYRPPHHWFAEADDVGLGAELERLAASLALEQLAALPADAVMSINLSPDTLLSADMLELLVGAPLDRIIVEVTEHRAVENYAAMLAALAPLRRRGLKLAVDDAGAGFASLKHILNIRPDIIKLDISLSRGIDRDPVRKALATAMIHFADAIGSELVAEGVESPAELASLRALNINMVQGHLFAKPGPIDALGFDVAERAAA